MSSNDRGPSARPFLPGLAIEPAVLLADGARPDFRDVFVDAIRRSIDVAVAVTRVRLATLDLEAEDLTRIESMRVLVAELNALTLDAEARLIRADPRRADRVSLYRDMLESGRLEIRSAPLGGWSPDFTVFAGEDGPDAVLCGRHWFQRPHPHRGPALASLHYGEAARMASSRHAEIWQAAHDVGTAVWSILSKAERSPRVPRTAAG